MLFKYWQQEQTYRVASDIPFESDYFNICELEMAPAIDKYIQRIELRVVSEFSVDANVLFDSLWAEWLKNKASMVDGAVL